jgi:hypothetical protein
MAHHKEATAHRKIKEDKAADKHRLDLRVVSSTTTIFPSRSATRIPDTRGDGGQNMLFKRIICIQSVYSPCRVLNEL